MPRCWWAESDPIYQDYHDNEWGFPKVDDRRIFEDLCLDGFQAGLSWLTILKKRENFRQAFDNFEMEIVARYTEADVKRLLQDAGIIRHRGKIEASVNNAKQALKIVEEFGSLTKYVWQYERSTGRPATLTKDLLVTMTTSPQAEAMSKDLKKRGWKFVGPTIIYAFMQAVGIVNDHLHDCPVRKKAEKERAALSLR
jgi:DNA-3-methyladenine glycosylase I